MPDSDRRRRDLAAIHATAKRLGLSEDERRDVIFALTQHRTCSELDYTQLQRVRSHLEGRAKSQGLSLASKRVRRIKPAGEKAGLVAKVRAVLIDLGRYPDSYADGIAKRMFHVDRFEWLDVEQLRGVVGELAQYQRLRDARITAIEFLLHEMGQYPHSYADAIAKRLFGHDRFTTLRPEQLKAVHVQLVSAAQRIRAQAPASLK